MLQSGAYTGIRILPPPQPDCPGWDLVNGCLWQQRKIGNKIRQNQLHFKKQSTGPIYFYALVYKKINFGLVTVL